MFGRHKHTSRKSLLHLSQRLVIIRGDVDGHSRWVIAMVLDILTDRIDTQLDVVGRKIGSGLLRDWPLFRRNAIERQFGEA